MKRIVARESELLELANWRGARAQVWLFSVTFKRMAIRLSRLDEPEVLYVLAAGCEHLSGPFSWDSANVQLHREEDNETISDPAIGFHLVASSVVLAIGPSTELDTSFVHFLGEDPPTE